MLPPVAAEESHEEQVLGYHPEPPPSSDAEAGETSATEGDEGVDIAVFPHSVLFAGTQGMRLTNDGSKPDDGKGDGGATTEPEPAPVTPPSPPVRAIGISPRSFDGPGFYDAFARIGEAASIGVVQVTFAWDRLRGITDYTSYKTQYDWLRAPIDAEGQDIFEVHGLKRAFWLNFLNPAQPDRMNMPEGFEGVSFTDPAVAQAFIDECTWFAVYFEADYLAIGVEIDAYLAGQSVAEREALLSALNSVRAMLRIIRPGTVVFVYFQYENVRNNDLWEIIRPFAENSDLVAFSSYPSLPLTGRGTGLTAAEIPADYYAPIRQHFGDRPVAFAELGHPAAPCSYFPAGAPEEQEQFIRSLPGWLPAGTAFVTWTYLHDLDMSNVYPPEVAELFGSMGLLRTDGVSGESSWQAWQELP